MKKTKVMQILDKAKIAYEPKEYEYDENNFSGEYVANSVGLPLEMVFKTLVCEGEKNGFSVVLIPVNHEADLKKIATAMGDKKVKMVAVKDLLKIAGYERGACSPIGMKKLFKTFIDESCLLNEKTCISAGAKGFQVILNTKDLIDFIKAIPTDLV
ncbi:MAG: Cys-tRNA(Pro)/Cys-tRNA(Cys) deacylase YbaK [Alphaproteobacteria bacterium ADurb.Bin438]|nr:MAG: Cys-tRNA(Pro)/Cys-tRNA(Cys) deacylase YbaK [Alphaproteobacteria bacterium ADurb.Bin438]